MWFSLTFKIAAACFGVTLDMLSNGVEKRPGEWSSVRCHAARKKLRHPVAVVKLGVTGGRIGAVFSLSKAFSSGEKRHIP